jgi:hypothetical protein
VGLVAVSGRDLAAPDELTQRRSRLRPHERRGDKIVLAENFKPGICQTGWHRDACVDDERQCPRRDRAMAATTFGICCPERVVIQPSGRGAISPSSSDASRSASSITCCVPTLLARSLPDRIQRLIVSGSRPTRRAASGTVSTGVVYYNIANAGRFTSMRDPTRPKYPQRDSNPCCRRERPES